MGGEVLRAEPYERSAPRKPSPAFLAPRPLPARLPDEVPLPPKQPLGPLAPASSDESTAPMIALPPLPTEPAPASRPGRGSQAPTTDTSLPALALVLLGGGLLALAAVLLAWLALTH